LTTYKRITTQLLINLHIYFVEDGLGVIKVCSVHGAKTFGARENAARITGTVKGTVYLYPYIAVTALPVQNYA
jgi:hypothetical protein